MAATLHIQLLGEFQLRTEPGPLTTLKGERQQSLLAYLLLHRHAPQSRQHLAFSLWPDSNEAQARSNLRNLLHTLRQALPGPEQFLLSDTLTVQWRADAPFTLDVAEFQQALTHAQQAQAPTKRRHWLEEALRLYTGELLPGNYDDWLMPVREELRRAQIDAQEQLIQLLEEAGDYRAALQQAQRLLMQDLLHEPTYIQLMRLHALSGDRAGVRRIYQSCVTVLEQELGVEPSPTTQAAYEQYLRFQAPLPTPEAPPPAAFPVVEPKTQRSRPLPAPRTPFLGRKHELAELALRLADPTCRLLTVVGPGGMGKTRLAQETAKGHQPIFSDGVAFIALASVASADLLVSAIADAINFTLSSDAASSEQLLHYLHNKAMLLVLDNFEHLLAGAELLSTILDNTTSVKLLVTSRERLNLQEEWIFELGGLSILAAPSSEGEEDTAEALFLQSAQRVRQDFAPTTGERSAIHRICQLVGGLPLGIELAATWVRVLACTEIVGEIERSLDFLTTTMRNLPERHRSLRAVFDHSWQLLSPEEQRIFRRLAFFRGGFTRAVAEQVAEATLPILSTLVDKSLVQRMGSERFGLHQLLGQYAQERLGEAAEREQVQDRHLLFFAAWAEQVMTQAGAQTTGAEQLAVEQDNLWGALQWAATGGNPEQGLQLALTLHTYWEQRGHWQEGYAWFTRLLALPQASSPMLVRARVLSHAGRFALRLVDAATAKHFYEESLAIARYWQSVPDTIMALLGLGDCEADHAAAQMRYAESLTLSRALGYQAGVASALTALGHLASGAGQHEKAEAFYQEALAIRRALGERKAEPDLLRNLGILAFTQQDYGRAQEIYMACLQTYKALGYKPGVAVLFNDLADVALAKGEYAKARQLYGESLSQAWELGSKWDMAWNFESLGSVAILEDQPERAAYLLSVAEALFQMISARLRPDDAAKHEQLVATLRAQLSELTFTANWQQGQVAPLQQAVAYALASANFAITLA